MSKHVMLDLECLGNTPPGVILSIGAVAFTAELIGSKFYYRVDIASSLLLGLTVEQATLDWWQKQDARAKEAAFYSPGAAPIDEVLAKFSIFVDKDTYLWAKGPDYDCVLLAAAYKACGMKLPWSFRNTRDVRTILALSGVEQQVNALAHNALEDAQCQAEAVIQAHRKLGVPLQ